MSGLIEIHDLNKSYFKKYSLNFKWWSNCWLIRAKWKWEDNPY